MLHTENLICYHMKPTGRMGNIMFEYATLIGICVSKGVKSDNCASFEANPNENTVELPLQEFYRTFRIQPTTCPINNGITYRERSSVYDDKVLKQNNGATLTGYFQSYKYFHPHARSVVLSKYTFPDTILQAAHEFLQPFRQDPDYQVVCVHIRRGDKAPEKSASMYNKWAVSSDYYSKAISIMSKRLGKIKLIVFTGGSLHSNDADYQWTKANIIDPYSASTNVLVFGNTTSLDHMTTMQVMTLCPNLIMGASTFSWWAGYLGEHKNVIAPENLHHGVEFNPQDYYLPEWTLLNEKSQV